MTNAILVHGMPSKAEYYNQADPSMSNAHWFPWLQKQLIMQDIDTQTPEMLNSFEPNYAVWCDTFSRYDCTPETLLVGHSCGGGFLVRYFSEHPELRVDTMVLVAPWTDPDGELTSDFFDFEPDAKLSERVKRLLLFNSDDDHDSIHTTVQRLRDAYPGATYREFHAQGHFTVESMKGVTFPELFEALVPTRQ